MLDMFSAEVAERALPGRAEAELPEEVDGVLGAFARLVRRWRLERRRSARKAYRQQDQPGFGRGAACMKWLSSDPGRRGCHGEAIFRGQTRAMLHVFGDGVGCRAELSVPDASPGPHGRDASGSFPSLWLSQDMRKRNGESSTNYLILVLRTSSSASAVAILLALGVKPSPRTRRPSRTMRPGLARLVDRCFRPRLPCLRGQRAETGAKDIDETQMSDCRKCVLSIFAASGPSCLQAGLRQLAPKGAAGAKLLTKHMPDCRICFDQYFVFWGGHAAPRRA